MIYRIIEEPMNIISKQFQCPASARKGLCAAAILLFLLLPCPGKGADIAGEMAECAKIESDKARLQCFDALTGKRPARSDAPAAATPADPYSSPTAPVKEARKEADESGQEPSVMSRQWELDPKSRASRTIIRPHNPNYMLPVAYRSTLNQAPGLDVDGQARAQHMEAKFQLSLKLKLWEDIFDKDVDLWFGYTQLAFWQLYNSAFSSPFRETNYEPELLLNFRTNYDILGLKGRIINLGFNHQSNGRADPLSRSWNRAVANFGFERDKFSLLLKTWYRIPENSADDDNPDITKFMGNGEVWGYYYWKKHRFAVMFRNNLRVNNKGAVQLDWSFPLPLITNERFAGYIQYFNGYGESLIDYNNTVNRISIGFMLKTW
jgi:phospholipase A1/A2